jgi:hypothetical protein
MPHLPDRHDDHDTGLVAALAAGDATGADRDHATELVRTCPACAALREDLVLLAAATRALPAPRRTRDYRLSEAQAARLRPAGWRRLLAPFAAPRFRFAAPLGTAMATLGVAGLVLASLPGALPMAVSAPAPQLAPLRTTSEQPPSEAAGAGPASSSAASAGAPSAAPASSAAAPSASGSLTGGGVSLDSATKADASASPRERSTAYGTANAGRDMAAESPPTSTAAAPARAAPPSTDRTLVVVAGGLVLVGLALLVLRLTARRLA